MNRVAGTSHGLRTSVAIDPGGKTCGIVRRPLTPHAAALLAERCGL